MEKRKVLSSILTVIFVLVFCTCTEDDNNNSAEFNDPAVVLGGGTLEQKLKELQTTAENGKEYTFEISSSGTINPQILLFENKNITIHLSNSSGGGEKIIVNSFRYDDNRPLFTVGFGVTLILEGSITLKGNGRYMDMSYYNNVYNNVWPYSNDAPLIMVLSGGTLVMNFGTKIRYNFNSPNGGGVYVGINGTFTMNNGTISGDDSSSQSVLYGNGGGVYVDGTFTMKDGKISDIHVYNNGGGVYVGNGIFIMNGGEISSNYTSDEEGEGGGVYVSSAGTFNMLGGEIALNYSQHNGGGVYVASNGNFNKTGGTIYGIDGDNNKYNMAAFGKGDAVYVATTPVKLRNNTADPSVNLNSSTTANWEE